MEEKENNSIKKLEKIAKDQVVKDISLKILNANSTKEKYKIIYDYIVENYKYRYSILYKTYLSQILVSPEYIKYLTKYRNKYFEESQIDYNLIMNFIKYLKTKVKISNNKIEFCDEIIDINTTKRLIDYSNSYMDYYSKYKQELTKEKNHEEIYSTWISKYGACLEFSEIFLYLCLIFNLPCEVVNGSINSNNINVLHAWNAIIVNDELKYVDISSAIHCVDKTDAIHSKDDFFNKTFIELKNIDDTKELKERTISNTEKIKEFLIEYTQDRLSYIYRMNIFYENKSLNSLRLQMLYTAKKILQDEKLAAKMVDSYDFTKILNGKKR